jgi:ribosomal protein S12 methylthiotransferase
MKRKTFHLISLGCAKNTVDSNSMAGILINSGYSFEDNPKQAEILIVNTCGFIKPARDEALATLQELSNFKKSGQYLLAAGCMAERFSSQITTACPKVDGILGTLHITEMLSLIDSLKSKTDSKQSIRPNLSPLTTGQFAPQGGSAYLKIADGCSRRCAFCSIPLIKGNWKSRPAEEIFQDAVSLQNMGIRELILIAQDTTAYAQDRGEKDALPGLIEGILKAAPDIPWLRILYAFPGFVSDRLIDLMASSTIIQPYLDIPLQHAHPAILKRMLRPDDMGWVRETIAKMREKIPGIAIRSTFITGFPNETEEEFTALYDFLTEMKFDRVGVFPYYLEEGTSSAAYGDTVPEEIKTQRVDLLMKHQQEISHEINRSFIGKTLDVLIEGEQDGLLAGRSYRDAPEIDGLVFVDGKAAVGDIIPVRISSALEYDLIGKQLSS